MPRLHENKQLEQGQYDYFTSNDEISLLKWKGKRCVHILSNFHNPALTTSVQRGQKDGSTIPLSCPTALVDFNLNVNFIDRFDQLKSLYELDIRSKKWWIKIFSILLTVVL